MYVFTPSGASLYLGTAQGHAYTSSEQLRCSGNSTVDKLREARFGVSDWRAKDGNGLRIVGNIDAKDGISK